MDVKIYVDTPLAPDELIGRIDENGKIYAIDHGEEEYIGWIDYDEGDVYDHEDYLLGWAEDDGTIIAYYEDDDDEEELGYVTEEGALYYYASDEEETYFGKLTDMTDYAEGAAALLLFTEEDTPEE